MTTMTSLVRQAAMLAFAVAPILHAQSGSSIARRVAQAPDGEVRMTYATRPSVSRAGS